MSKTNLFYSDTLNTKERLYNCVFYGKLVSSVKTFENEEL